MDEKSILRIAYSKKIFALEVFRHFKDNFDPNYFQAGFTRERTSAKKFEFFHFLKALFELGLALRAEKVVSHLLYPLV